MMSASSTPTVRHPTVAGAARSGAVVVVVAALVNLGLLVLGRAVGADMHVSPAGSSGPQEVGAALVLMMTALPVVLGAVALAIASRWGSRGWSVLAWVGLAIGIVTVVLPLGTQSSTSTGLTLAGMHVVVGTVWFVVVRRSVANR